MDKEAQERIAKILRERNKRLLAYGQNPKAEYSADQILKIIEQLGYRKPPQLNDKEDIEKIAERLACHADCEWQYMTEEKKNSFREIAKDIIQYLFVLGYRKPKEKPPLLSSLELEDILATPRSLIQCEDAAQAQREADIKHYEEGLDE